MSYRADFWLAVSAAAPVITLATVVAMPDVLNVAMALTDPLPSERLPPDAPDDREISSGRIWLIGTVTAALAFFNLLVQAGVLAVSLAALAVGRDVIPPWVAIVLAVGGALVLALTLVVGAAIRRVLPYYDPPTFTQ